MIDTVGTALDEPRPDYSDNDTVIAVYDEVGNLVQWNDDIGWSESNYSVWSRLTFGDSEGDLAPGQYYLAAKAYDTFETMTPGRGFQFGGGSPATGTIDVNFLYGADVGALPQGMTQTDPQPLNVPDPGESEVQWYRFELADDIAAAEGDLLVIHTEFSSVFDTEIGLYDANGQKILENDDIDPGNSNYHSYFVFGVGSDYSEIVLPAGIYYLAVGSFNTAFGDTYYDVTGGVEYVGDIELRFSASWVPVDLPGDYNDDGVVDAADYVIWRKYEGTDYLLANDPLGGTIGAVQYNTWRTNYGEMAGSGSVATANAAVPEPATLVILIAAAVGIRLRRRQIAD